jgi:ribose/xylose/arabinose/galactoside ABC-type transport system permease subunit
MRFPFQIGIIVILGFFLELFFPWWSVAIAAFIGGLLVTTRTNFLAGFLAIGLLWVIKALIIDLSTDSGLADRVARIFMLQNKALLLLVTFILSGLVGGFSSMSGGALRTRR